MSKAFTRESDDAPEAPLVRPVSVLPPGLKNLLTPGGALQLRQELEQLTTEEATLRERGDEHAPVAVKGGKLAGLLIDVHPRQQILHTLVPWL